ncbi:TPA: glycosyltransferase family 2 protein [Clostridium perfringens]|nr:glycosyltransferase family 2 protein [Clostridium perfringens]MDU2445114.1 glycosyltransferase family 2 protein [Clostridium perfringens]
MQYKVSVITPAFNCEKHIRDTIKSVQAQTYVNWEMIIVDDCSSDSTCKIIEEISNEDSRIKLYKLKNNSGAAKARNKALELANGRFIAYLDADDIWLNKKLEKQVEFMLKNNYGFTCVSYEVIGNDGELKGKTVKMLKSVNYKEFLTNNLLQTVGIMIDTEIVNKKLLVMPDMRRRQDAATWLQILKAGYKCYGISQILAQYRRAQNSLSSNKVKAAKGVWYLYRKVEKLSLIFSCYCFCRYAILAVWKRVYYNKNKNECRCTR